MSVEEEDELNFHDDDADVSDLNNPDIETMPEPPLLTGRVAPSDIYGESADSFGRASSPKLYAQQANFPNAMQLRVWRWENGVPVAIGPIDAEATEEDFVRQFFSAMPKPGEGRFQFRLRPIDVRGRELGKEITLNISEHHQILRQIRESKKREEEERMSGGGWGGRDPLIINQGGHDPAASSAVDEMGRMFEMAVEKADQRTELLQRELEEQRERLRQEETYRVQERIATAEKATNVVEKLTDRLMTTDRQRAEEVLSAQREQSQMMVSTLTTVFSQQQQAAREAAERQRDLDARKAEQDREFYERQRRASEDERKRERDEFERKQAMEREEQRAKMERERMESDRQRELMREEREKWRQELEEKRRLEREEWERKMLLEREDRERRERNDRERFEREKLEIQTRLEREKIEAEARREAARREDEARDRARREEAERREQQRRDELLLQQKQLDVAAQRDREHAERMMEMARLEREAQREAQLQREKSEREAREAADKERQRQHELALRDMEMSRERDREHQERMLQLSRIQNTGGFGAMTDMLGMETPELLARIFGGGGGEGGGGWADAIPKVLSSIADIGKVALTQQGASAGQQHGRRAISDRGGEKVVTIQTPQGPKTVPVSALAGIQQVQTSGIPPVRPAARPQAPQMDLPEQGFVPPGSADEDDEETQVIETALAESEESVAPSPFQEALEVNTLKRAKDAGMPLLKQKKARKAVRALVDRLAKEPEESWDGIVTEAITTEASIFDYIRAVTVYVALAEGGADENLATRVVTALKASGLIPEGVIPYDEADLARLGSAGREE
jgi:hypothetical protein